ncbi:MAG: 3-phosphoshikimate 1-carboxyvinyltransferase [Rhodospirillales bacterium]|nr:3-phosphoshikimate 1-carboxyvinyltransferase [Rhodospirillales bacterium]
MSNTHKQSEALSPWGMPAAAAVEVLPLSGPFEATLALPGSKSFTNRALILAAVAKGTSILRSPLFSDDSYWCIDALQKLGISARSVREDDRIDIEGLGAGGSFHLNDAAALPYIGSAGTIARFLPGVIAARGVGEITLTSSAQLARRPVSEMIAALRQLGAEIVLPEHGAFPMKITGGSLKGGTATISGQLSSQFISGLLIAAPLAQTPVTLSVTGGIVQADYVRMTLSMMEDFGVQVKYSDDLSSFYIEPQEYRAREITLEADASTATYFVAAAAATKSRITITNLNPETLQPDFLFLEYLEKMGCSVTQEAGHIILQGPQQLQGNKVFDFNACSDSTPALAGIAPFSDGAIEVRGVAHIRKHESDRLSVMHGILQQAGVDVTEYEDGLNIIPVRGMPRHVVVDPHDDHRMAMAFSVMGLAGAGATITDPSCVSKTCPNFFELLQKIGVRCDIVGAV